MPVNVSGSINSKQIKVTIRDGAVKPFFLGSENLSTMVVLGSRCYPRNQEGLYLIVQGGLWLHRNGMPMGENESIDSQYIKTNEEKRIENSDEITITNPNNRENSIIASYMPARAKT